MELAVLQLSVVVPFPGERGDARLTFDAKLRADLGRLRVVQVAPAGAPDDGAVLPAPVGAGEQDLEGLGETGLARTVAPDDQRQTGPWRQVESLRGADAPKSLHA